MSVRFTSSSNYLQSTNRDFTAVQTTGFTVMFWMYQVVNRGTFSYIFVVQDLVRKPAIGTDATGNSWGLEDDTFGSAVTVVSLNAWHHFCWVYHTNTNSDFWIDGVKVVTGYANQNFNQGTLPVILGNYYDLSTSFGYNGRMAAFKMWQRPLADNEVLNEMNVILPLNGTGLSAWLPMFFGSGERGRDYSATKDFSEGGTLTDEDPPPVSWGSTTFLIQIPAMGGSSSINVSDAGTGADSATVAVTLTITDAGSGADAPTITVSFSVADAGAGVDVISQIAAALTIPDAGTGADALSPLAVALNILEAGLGTEGTPGVAVSLTLTDAGSGAENVTAGTAILILDAASGVDAITSISVTIPVSDVGQATDLISQVAAAFTLADAGSGLDALTVNTGAAAIASIVFTLAKRSVKGGVVERVITFTVKERTTTGKAAERSVSYILNKRKIKFS